MYLSFLDEISVYNNILRDLSSQYYEARANENDSLLYYADSVYNVVNEEQKELIKKYVLENNTSIVSAYVAWSNIHRFKLDELSYISESFDKAISGSFYVKDIKKNLEILKNVALGQEAPDFALKDTTGKQFTLSSFNNKYVLVYFWASWCIPCRTENLYLAELYTDFKDKDFEILGISLDNERDERINAIIEDNINWNNLTDLKFWENEAAILYGVRKLPHNLILDKEGRIIAKNLYGESLRSKIEELCK
jgi:peroxiredoxin